MIAERFNEMQPSATLAVNAKALELKEKGFNVINFSVGEPDFNSPEIVKKAGIKAIQQDFTRYTEVSGITDLREKIKEKLLKENNLNYSAEEIVVSNGAKQALFNSIMALCSKGDEVIIPCPFWVSYKAMVLLAEAKPVFTSNKSLKITPEEFENSITEKTRAIILNSPSNPTGLIYRKKELASLAEIAVNKKINVISDEIYEKIIFDEKHYSIASFNDEIKNLTVTVNGFSKAYSMTGYRIGYSASNSETASAIKKLQSHSTGSVCSFVQKSALASFELNKKESEKHAKELKKKRDFLAEELKKTKIDFILPDGAFYFFLNLKNISGDDIKFCSGLLEQKQVALVPGTAFGMKGYIRLSYAVSMKDLKEGIKRIKEFIK